MADSIKKKFFTGIIWSFVQNIAVRVLSVLFTVVLARLLLPEDYGLIGMLAIFIAVSDVFIQSGFGQALVQKTDCNDEDFSTAFYFNVTVSAIIYIALFFAAPLIAGFYKEPRLIVLTRVLSLNFVLGSLNIVQQSKLSKAMNFKPLAIVSLISTFFSGVVGVGFAFFGFGVWALVAQTLTATFLRVLIFPFFTKWAPNRPFNYQSFLHLWRFGSKILIAGILDVFVRNFSNILIGRFYNKQQVGYYSKALEFAEFPAVTMSSVLGTVVYPLLSEIHEDEKHQADVFKRISINTVIITFPVIILLALLAKPIVIILFTNKWEASIPLLQALLLSRIFLSLNIINANLLQSRGETKLFMKLYFIAAPLSLVAITISIPFGVKAMAWATFIAAFLYFFVFSVVIGKKIKYRLINQLKDLWPVFVSLFIMSICVYLSTHWLTGMWAQLIIGCAVGAIVYLLCCFAFHLIDSDIRSVVYKYMHK